MIVAELDRYMGARILNHHPLSDLTFDMAANYRFGDRNSKIAKKAKKGCNLSQIFILYT